jgi:hypothetical protein
MELPYRPILTALVAPRERSVYAPLGRRALVRFKERGRSRKRVFRTMALAPEFKGQIDGGSQRSSAEGRVLLGAYGDTWIGSHRGRRPGD